MSNQTARDESDFANKADRPKAWFVKGTQLKIAADRCGPPDASKPYEMGETPYVHVMLLGMAIEAMLKAASVFHRGSRLEKREGRPTAFLGGFAKHDLRRLAKELGDQTFSISDAESGLLERLELFIKWFGRYPVPRHAREMKDVGTSSLELTEIARLYERLHSHLIAHEAELNDLR